MNLFEINNTQKSFEGKLVLKIDKLSIPSGKRVFIIGSSGVGKTTLLELLGLMSEPDKGKGEIKIDLEGKENLYSKLWTENDTLSKFRSQNLSFIFQNNHMMRNLKVKDNLKLPRMINWLQTAREDEFKFEFESEKISKFQIPISRFEELPDAFSAGQKQRLAFIQAALKEFKILFADEPTGNLDFFNGERLMDFIEKYLIETQSAIIVSHNLHLASKYGEIVMIMNLEKEGQNVYGTIKHENIFENPTYDLLKCEAEKIFSEDEQIINKQYEKETSI